MEAATEFVVRIASFATVFVVMLVWERAVPARRVARKWSARSTGNMLLMGINTALLRLLMPLSLVGIAIVVEREQFGVLHQLSIPMWSKIVGTVLVLDLAVYAQHVAMHKIPLLWRIHLVHHADPEFDVTTGVRFHTLEILVSAMYKAAIVALLGLPAVGVLVFEVLLNATSMFTHGNVHLPSRAERVVRACFVTPDMHRVHHSTIPDETNSNFGFNVSWWDRFFRTYRDQPIRGHSEMQIGLSNEREERHVARLTGILLLPFTASRK